MRWWPRASARNLVTLHPCICKVLPIIVNGRPPPFLHGRAEIAADVIDVTAMPAVGKWAWFPDCARNEVLKWITNDRRTIRRYLSVVERC